MPSLQTAAAEAAVDEAVVAGKGGAMPTSTQDLLFRYVQIYWGNFE
jgi:hypothetical protein